MICIVSLVDTLLVNTIMILIYLQTYPLHDTVEEIDIMMATGDGACDLVYGDIAIVVRFVIPEGRTEVSVTESLALAFEQAIRSGMNPVWVQEQKVLNISPNKTVQSLLMGTW